MENHNNYGRVDQQKNILGIGLKDDDSSQKKSLE